MRTEIIGALGLVLVAVMVYMVAADTACDTQNCYVNTTLTVGNSAPSITGVQGGIIVVGTGEQNETVYVTFNVTDLNSYSDVNDSTAQCIGYKSGEANRTSTSCTAQDQSGNDLTYNCSTTFQYYDVDGTWNWNCSVSDNYPVSVFNDTMTFTMSVVDYIDINATAFAWSNVNPSVDDQEANTAINFDNGGNQNYETAAVTAQNATDGNGNVVPGTAFALNSATGSPAGTQMNATVAVDISSWFTLPHGEGISEDLFAYVDMPTVPSGSYSSTSSWLIDITT